MSDYAIARVDDVPGLQDGECTIRPVRHHFGIAGFGVNAWSATDVGDRLIPEHREADETEDEADRDEELYLVLRGRAVFELDDERRDAPAGTFVFVRPRVKRTAFAEEPGTVVVAIGGTPGKPYRNLGWELWHPLRKLYESGDYAAVVDRGRALVAANPDSGLLHYNLACCESLVGDKAEALGHLRTAIALDDEFRTYAASDSDLDPIRGEPGFEDLVTPTAPS